MNAPPQIAPQSAAAVSVAAVSAANDLAFEAIVENAELAASYAVSVREAAWRGIEISSACTWRSFG
jgi:hypothetical protein